MIVKCVNDDLTEVDADSKLIRELKNRYGEFNQTLGIASGNVYIVYGIMIKGDIHRYFIADDIYKGMKYPVAYEDIFFDVIDGSVSRCWTIEKRDNINDGRKTIITFKEWATNSGFYEQLVDGDKEARKCFQQKKEFMDFEFPNPDIDFTAEIANENWLLCPKCQDAWESQSTEGMVKCSSCGSLLKNPRFDKEF